MCIRRLLGVKVVITIIIVRFYLITNIIFVYLSFRRYYAPPCDSQPTIIICHNVSGTLLIKRRLVPLFGLFIAISC